MIAESKVDPNRINESLKAELDLFSVLIEVSL